MKMYKIVYIVMGRGEVGKRTHEIEIAGIKNARAVWDILIHNDCLMGSDRP